jgi:hypothetical protein
MSRVACDSRAPGPTRSSWSAIRTPSSRSSAPCCPNWTTLTGLCLKAARAFPGLRMQAWDVAPTERGPVLVEVNIGGDFNLPQLAHATGLMDERFRAFSDHCAKGAG